MPPLAIDDATLLEAWDRASPLERPWRELTLLASTGEEVETLAHLPVGERDRRLLALRRMLLGDRLECETSCPACGERLELVLAASALAGAPVDAVAESTVEHAGCRVRFRLPTSADLAASSAGPDAAQALLGRCVLEATCGDERLAADALTPALLDVLAARMAELDPQANVRLALECAACSHRWDADLDVAGFVLAEIDAHATRLLAEVHGLASAYGWREADILALGPRRRRRYLELAWA
jgi:hypothetical protein